MGSRGCSSTGVLDISKFSEPMPWIGLYRTAASVALSLLMAIDTFSGFRHCRLWFPGKWFSLNAISLTLLSIATKPLVDLSAPMPSHQDQLTKLSGTVLICTTMANFMVSLGRMDSSEMLSSISALGLLVFTVIIDVGIQMGTGAIYVFIREHAIIMFFMLFLLETHIATAFVIPTAKEKLESAHAQVHWSAFDEPPLRFTENENSADELTKFAKRISFMALSIDPQYVVGHLVTSTSSGAFSLLSALILLVAVVRSLIPGYLDFCHGESDYKWSSWLVLISQLIAVAIATIAPAIRWYSVIGFEEDVSLVLDSPWHEKPNEWAASLPSRFNGRRWATIAFHLVMPFVFIWVLLNDLVVIICKIIRVASTILLSRLISRCSKSRRESESSMILPSGRIDWAQDQIQTLEREERLCSALFALGKTGLVDRTKQISYLELEQWIQKGRKNQPTDLINLLNESTLLNDFRGLPEFDSNRVPQIAEANPSCWALPIATLASIAVALPSIDQDKTKSLQHAVNEGLRYVRFIEKRVGANFVPIGLNNVNAESRTVRMATKVNWSDAYIHYEWLGKSLHYYAYGVKHAKETIEKFVNTARQVASSESLKHSFVRDCALVAANSTYRIGGTLLLDYENKFQTADELFQWLQVAIADTIGACLTNLPKAIIKECYGSPIEVRKKRARKAARFIGETESLLRNFGNREFPDVPSSKQADIDEWPRRNFR